MKRLKNAKRIKRKLHNMSLCVITFVAYITFLISASAMDSDSYIQIVTLFISLAWLLLFAKANEGRW